MVFSGWGALAGDFKAGGEGLGYLSSSRPASLLSGMALFLNGSCSQSVVPGPQPQHHLRTFYKCKFWGPTTDLLNHKLWEWVICVLRSPLARENLRTTALGSRDIPLISCGAFVQLSPFSALEDHFCLSQMRGSFAISLHST